MSVLPRTRPTEIITDPIEIVRSTIRVDRHRRDPLKGALIVASIALACMAGTWAIVTHREWLRLIDALVALLAVCEVARLLLTRLD